MIAGPPHPDTARADAAERMLEILAKRLSEDETRVLCTAYPCFGEWWSRRMYARKLATRVAELTALRDRERAALATTERELEALTRRASETF